MTSYLCYFSMLLAGLSQVPEERPDQGVIALVRHEFRETHMGSEIKLIFYTKQEASAKEASRAVFERFAALDGAFNDYEPDSELNRLCDEAGGPAVRVSGDLMRILALSEALSIRTGGAFDASVKPVVRLWRRAFRQKELPDPEELAEARALVDYRAIELDREAGTVRLGRAGMRLDLGGIAKGYACDRAHEVLRERGIDRALVAAAGDIVVSGPPPGEEGWRVGIGPLEDPTAEPERVLVVHDCAVSTSGDTERFAEIGGKRYAHIVDPRTGLGKVERASVTVVAPDGTSADSLGTAIYLLGVKEGLAIAEGTPGVAALYVRKTEEGLEEATSRRWAGLKVEGGEQVKETER